MTNNMMLRYQEAILKEVSEAIQLLKDNLDFLEAKMSWSRKNIDLRIDISNLNLIANMLTSMENTFRKEGILKTKKKDPVSLHIENINC